MISKCWSRYGEAYPSATPGRYDLKGKSGRISKIGNKYRDGPIRNKIPEYGTSHAETKQSYFRTTEVAREGWILTRNIRDRRGGELHRSLDVKGGNKGK